MDTSLKDILKLIEKKYPTNYKGGINPALFIYDDQSGKIIRNAMYSVYESGNHLFEFTSIEDLVNHLRES